MNCEVINIYIDSVCFTGFFQILESRNIFPWLDWYEICAKVDVDVAAFHDLPQGIRVLFHAEDDW